MQAGFNCNMFLGWSWSYFATGRFTSITGSDIKKVVGLDGKKVDFALDLKGIDLSDKLTAVQQEKVKAWKDGLKAGNGNMQVEMFSAVKLTT